MYFLLPQTMQIFVPGRLCLFGEHSDWAGSYRCHNPELKKGYTLLVGTNQGLYANVKSHPSHLLLKMSLNNGHVKTLTLNMEKQTLLEVAKAGGFFSYAAGVAYQILNHYQVGGLEIDNYCTDLPIKKGLSSSAAICVLVARAFNQVYDLKMNHREEMEFAYQGEITTPSSCGRMDQACAYGNQPIAMVFDGHFTEVIPLTAAQNLFFVIVDLGASKNTQQILTQLHQCYPFARNDIEKQVQEFLGAISYQITQEAVAAIQTGDAEKIGILMKQFQAYFDHYLIPACPTELTAPILHKLLNHPPIQLYIFGGKGVGSQGDGTAQFIVKDAASQQKLIDIINRDFPAMQCLKLTIYAQPSS
jgi:galactokinase